MIPSSPEETQRALEAHQYIADKGLSVSVFLALKLGRPLLLEGEPGVGKTEIVKVLSQMLETRLIRLQCYEGLDVSSAVYEWDYARQMLQIRLLEASGERDQAKVRGEVFGSEYLLERPLMQALRSTNGKAPVLLIDELDRADEEFEAFLLEFLSDWQITIPEVGTVRAGQPPVVVITSNRTREIHDALKRRCLYFWIDYPSFEKEYRIVREKVPGVPEKLAQQVVAFVQELRKEDLYKAPGVAETLDWASSLIALDAVVLEPSIVEETLGALLKYQDDVVRAKNVAQNLLARANMPTPM
ncbi:MAG: MoxR family ATPase [Thermaceae bacterium]|nr:MoxR family ATPase [Thermaceae bacterium]